MSEQPTYRNVQRGHWSLLLIAIGVTMIASSWFLRDETALVWLLAVIGGLMVIFAAAFHHLIVEDDGDGLSVSFGPIRLFRKSISYHEITEIAADHTTLLDGWGIHKSFRGGWVWNIWGRACVKITCEHEVIRIGTDDGPRLLAFLASRIPDTAPSTGD